MTRIVTAALAIAALGTMIGFATLHVTPTEMAWCCAEDPPCPVVMCEAAEKQR